MFIDNTGNTGDVDSGVDTGGGGDVAGDCDGDV